MSADKRTLQNRQFAGNRFSALIFNALVLLAGLILLFPLFWIVITAMKGQMDVLKHPLAVIPQEFMLLENLETVLERAPWGTFALNTALVAGGVLLAQLAVSIPAAYAFAFMRFFLKRVLYLFLIARLLVTAESLLLPNYLTINHLGLYDTLTGIALPNVPTAIAILMFIGAFREIPAALRESAQIDGCGDFRYMVSIAVPCITPRIIAFSITSIIYQWNSYFWPMMITESVNKRTIAVGLAYFGRQAESASEWGLTMVAALMFIIPMSIIFLIFQKQLINSFVTSGIK